MTNPSFSIRVYSFYLFLMGTCLMVVPNLLLSIFGFTPTSEVWIRMLGLFTFTTGIYYLYSSLNQQTAFYKATIIGRLFFFVMTIVIVFVFHQNPMLILIGSVDLFGAIWTLYAFKRETIKARS